MRIVEPSHEIRIPGMSRYLEHIRSVDLISPENNTEYYIDSFKREFFRDQAQAIEYAGRVAYASLDKITPDSYKSFISSIIKRDHGAVLEFGDMTAVFSTDRGIANECVRHRLCSFLQTSTRYVNYCQDKFGKEITVIKPSYIPEGTNEYLDWYTQCLSAEKSYMELIAKGVAPQNARSVLPLCTQTNLVIKTNFREWRHIFRLRVLGITGAPHPDIAKLFSPLYNECKMYLPEVFELDYKRPLI
jgi:thymidylate synthase (FAD)